MAPVQGDANITVFRCGDLEGKIFPVADHLTGIVTASDEPLDAKDRVLRVGHRLALGDLAHQALAVAGNGHHRGRGSAAVGIGDDRGVTTVHDGYTRIGCSKIDSDSFAHFLFLR
jgi:hypothetical protein